MRRMLTLALLALPVALSAQETPARQEVTAAVHAFHAALAAGDSTGALGLLHPDVLIFESGRSETLAQYRSGHLRSDIAFAAATTREVSAETVAVTGDAALYTSQAHTTGQFRNRDIDSRAVETIVLTRTPDGWRILHIHWSSR